MTIEATNWIAALTAAGHVPIMRPGYDDATDPPMLDEWVLDEGFHNGPGCEVCGMTWCMHCTSPTSVLAPCTGKAGVIADLKATIATLTEKLARLKSE